MPVEVTRRCVACHQLKDSAEFKLLRLWVDNRGKKHRILDVYCRTCSARISPAQRRADARDIRPADR